MIDLHDCDMINFNGRLDSCGVHPEVEGESDGC